MNYPTIVLLFEKEMIMKQNVIILDSETISKDLANYFTNRIINDPELVLNCILKSRPLNGNCGVVAPDMSTLTDEDVADLFAEFNLGEKYASEHEVSLVLAKLSDLDLRVLWGNLC